MIVWNSTKTKYENVDDDGDLNNEYEDDDDDDVSH